MVSARLDFYFGNQHSLSLVLVICPRAGPRVCNSTSCKSVSELSHRNHNRSVVTRVDPQPCLLCTDMILRLYGPRIVNLTVAAVLAAYAYLFYVAVFCVVRAVAPNHLLSKPT